MFAASENAVFSFDLTDNQLETYTTIEGLSGELISNIHVSEAFNMLIVGYQNGLMEIYDLGADQVTTVVDILDKPTIPPDLKRINHFHEYEGLIYISTDFGISVYDLERLEFGDTYFIGNGGAQQAVFQTSVFGDYIYAAMGQNGMKRALIASENLIDFSEWSQLFTGNLITVESLEDRLYTAASNQRIFDITSGSASLVATYNSDILDHKSANGNMVVVLQNEVFVYDSEFNLVSSHQPSPEFNNTFSSATSILDEVFIGSNGAGLLTAPFSNPTETPDSS